VRGRECICKSCEHGSVMCTYASHQTNSRSLTLDLRLSLHKCGVCVCVRARVRAKRGAPGSCFVVVDVDGAL